ncbi:MAG: hypothetical protein ILP13_09740 [Lachnospiraceae bacterium]|nr:hypothetical protein [Lachnospiraceae bacterium]
MVIVYGYRNSLNVKKRMGMRPCPNCGYNTEQALAEEKFKATIFYIPIFSHTMRRGQVCPNCGMYRVLNRKEFKEELNKY